LAGLPARDSPKLQAPSCQKRRGAKGTLFTVRFDFYHLSKIDNSDKAIQRLEIIAKTPNGREAGAGSHSQSQESAAA
jgi:hypothetical protein